MAKVRIIKLNPGKADRYRMSVYDHTHLMYAFAGKPLEGEVKQLTRFVSCREELIKFLFDYRTSKIPRSRLRILVRNIRPGTGQKPYKPFERKTTRGLRVLNIMEEHYSWPLTIMHDVEESPVTLPASFIRGRTSPSVTYLKLLEASSRWMRSPHMLSLFTLLFRLPSSTRRFSLASVNKTYESLMVACKGCTTSSHGDNYNVAKTFPFWEAIMTDFDKMFTGIPFTRAFDFTKYVDKSWPNRRNWGDEGIAKLCSLKSGNEEITSRFKDIVKQAGLA